MQILANIHNLFLLLSKTARMTTNPAAVWTELLPLPTSLGFDVNIDVKNRLVQRTPIPFGTIFEAVIQSHAQRSLPVRNPQAVLKSVSPITCLAEPPSRPPNPFQNGSDSIQNDKNVETRRILIQMITFWRKFDTRTRCTHCDQSCGPNTKHCFKNHGFGSGRGSLH